MNKRVGAALTAAWFCLIGICAGCGGDTTQSKGAQPVADDDDEEVVLDVPDAAACDPENMPEVPNNGISYPDGHCGPEGCSTGRCDPLGRCSPACNAWSFSSKVSFQAVTVDQEGTLGAQSRPTDKDSEDVCPGNMLSVTLGPNCCQRGDNSKASMPALKLTSLMMSQPVYFATPIVTGVNKAAIETDLYNWIMVLSSKEDGDVTITSGMAMPNTDSTWRQVKGPFESGGQEFNKDGLWDAHGQIPGKLVTDANGRKLIGGPSSPTQDYVMVVWMDNKYDFARLQLHLRGVSWELPLDADMNCSGERTPGQFEQVGTLKGYVPVDAAMKTDVWISRTGSQNLCTSTSGAVSCDGSIASWKPAN